MIIDLKLQIILLNSPLFYQTLPVIILNYKAFTTFEKNLDYFKLFMENRDLQPNLSPSINRQSLCNKLNLTG